MGAAMIVTGLGGIACLNLQQLIPQVNVSLTEGVGINRLDDEEERAFRVVMQLEYLRIVVKRRLQEGNLLLRGFDADAQSTYEFLEAFMVMLRTPMNSESLF